MVSIIIPYVSSRREHLEKNLLSLDNQTDKDFEVILVCQNCYFSETRPYMKKLFLEGVPGQNPSKAQNVGVAAASGNIVVLTSPEVINASTNISVMKTLPDNMFWLGRVVEEEINVLPADTKDWTSDNLRKIYGDRKGIVAICVEGNWHAWTYFLGIIHRTDFLKIGGMDEEYMEGIAWEDRDFSDRVRAGGIEIGLNSDIVGIHLKHERTYQDNGPELRAINKKLYYSKNGRK